MHSTINHVTDKYLTNHQAIFDKQFTRRPGHQAFHAMRQHGATVTDVIILVVAATEGVRPQTKECIRLAEQANVPIVVAINKCDLHDANPSRTREELLQVVMAAMGGLKVMSIACVFERCVSFDDEFHNIF